jgi:hypothetical protein
MTNSPISKNHEFLKEFGINIKELDGDVKLVFSYLVNEIDGISKMKMALEIDILTQDFLENLGCSQDILLKFSFYQMWLIQHNMNEIIELCNRLKIHMPASILFHNNILQDARFAEAVAIFQSEEWQRKIWGKWATPPYEDS